MDKEIIKKLESALYDAFMNLDSLKLAIGNRKALLNEISNDFEKVESLIYKLKEFDLQNFKSALKAFEESLNTIILEQE